MTNGGGGKAGDRDVDVDVREGAEQATLSSWEKKRTAIDEADEYGGDKRRCRDLTHTGPRDSDDRPESRCET